MMATIRKAVGALLGGVTGAGVAAVLRLFGLDVPPEVAAAIAVLASTLGAYLAPANEPRTP